MRLKDIQVGKWYETKAGLGKCLSVSGYSPPVATFDIRWPIPRGKCHVKPRDVSAEIDAPPDESVSQ